jgi:hypothetical protein
MSRITANTFKVRQCSFITEEVNSQNGCEGCYFAISKGSPNTTKEALNWRIMMCEKYACTPISRVDKRNVIFKKIEVK